MTGLRTEQVEELVELLQRGEDVPREYKQLLFPSTQAECELSYSGKKPEPDVLVDTLALPIQPVRHFNGGAGDESSNAGGWTNKVIFGDNLQTMKTLLQLKSEGQLLNADGTNGIRLIYMDPPFATKRDFTSSDEELAYRDKVVGAEFVEFMRRRLILMRELLAPDGCIYVHLDEKKSHYIKLVMDEVFGEHRFQREIVWRMGWLSGYKTAAKNWIRNHDVILYYSLDPSRFNKSYIPYPKGYVRRGGTAPTGKGVPLEDTWNCNELDRLNSIQIVSFSGEKTGFPTQKNEDLLARIIEASSSPGDLVLDPFVGSGTTLAVAEKLGRRWIGIDSAKVAIYTTQKRLLNLRHKVGNTGEPIEAKPFALYNAGLYDFSKLRELPWREWRRFALDLFECRDRRHTVAGVQMDGTRRGADVLVFDHTTAGGVVLDHGFVQDLHGQLASKASGEVFLIAPAASVAFLEDYIDLGDTRYYILRIPYSIIDELHHSDFTALQQPMDARQINQTVDSIGFDFIRPPRVACTYGQTEDALIVTINTFISQANAKGASRRGNREALSMVLIDYDYSMTGPDGTVSPFELDAVVYEQELAQKAFTFEIPKKLAGERVAIIYLDVYGNEFTEIKTADDFLLDS